MLFEEVNKNGTTSRKKWSDLKTWQKAAAIGGAGLVTFILYKGIQSVSGGNNIKAAPVDYGQIPTLPSGFQWDPDPLAKELAEKLQGYNFYTYPEVTDKILKLNNDQLRLLYNHYNSYYSEGETLTELIDGEWDDWSGSYARAVSKLRGQGLM